MSAYEEKAKVKVHRGTPNPPPAVAVTVGGSGGDRTTLGAGIQRGYSDDNPWVHVRLKDHTSGNETHAWITAEHFTEFVAEVAKLVESGTRHEYVDDHVKKAVASR